jgi:type IV fimbrial biogenesis protein FimT
MKNSGFTLVELVLTVTVAAILTAIAVPSFQSAIANNRATTQANAIVTALRLARNEAVKRQKPVTVCARSTSETDPKCAGGDWKNGWMVFVDPDDSGTEGEFDNEDGDKDVRLRVFEAPSGHPIFTHTTTKIRFDASGNSLFGQGTVSLKQEHCTTNEKRIINVLATGLVSVSLGGC